MDDSGDGDKDGLTSGWGGESWHDWCWRNESESWFQRWGDAYLNERSVIFSEEMVGGYTIPHVFRSFHALICIDWHNHITDIYVCNVKSTKLMWMFAADVNVCSWTCWLATAREMLCEYCAVSWRTSLITITTNELDCRSSFDCGIVTCITWTRDLFYTSPVSLSLYCLLSLQ